MPQDELAPQYDRTLLIDSVASLEIPLPMGDSAVSGERAKPEERQVEPTAIHVDERMGGPQPPPSDAITLDADADAEADSGGSSGSTAVLVFASLFVFSVCFALSALAVIALMP